MIPDEAIILLSGIPATCKSTFGRYLASNRAFAHYDLEKFPTGWPFQDLKIIWDRVPWNARAFVEQLRHRHRRIALDWGFPVGCIARVIELQDCGVRLIWFDGNTARAREAFLSRGEGNVWNFDRQVEAIKRANFPAALNSAVVVHSLPASGPPLDPADIEKIVFPE